MKKAGIICDNYKVEKFRKELTDNGFYDFEVNALNEELTTISVNVSDEKLVEIKRLCANVELYFKHSN